MYKITLYYHDGTQGTIETNELRNSLKTIPNIYNVVKITIIKVVN